MCHVAELTWPRQHPQANAKLVCQPLFKPSQQLAGTALVCSNQQQARIAACCASRCCARITVAAPLRHVQPPDGCVARLTHRACSESITPAIAKKRCCTEVHFLCVPCKCCLLFTLVTSTRSRAKQRRARSGKHAANRLSVSVASHGDTRPGQFNKTPCVDQMPVVSSACSKARLLRVPEHMFFFICVATPFAPQCAHHSIQTHGTQNQSISVAFEM